MWVTHALLRGPTPSATPMDDMVFQNEDGGISEVPQVVRDLATIGRHICTSLDSGRRTIIARSVAGRSKSMDIQLEVGVTHASVAQHET